MNKIFNTAAHNHVNHMNPELNSGTVRTIMKIMVLTIAIATATTAQATNEAFVKLSTDVPATEEFSLSGAEVLIEGNLVKIVYDGKPEQNRTFDFDRITSFQFGLRKTTSVDNSYGAYPLVFRAYVDDACILHVESAQPLRLVNVYTTAGVLVTSQKTNDNKAQVNLSSAPCGVYIVQSGSNRQLVIR